MHYNLCLVVKGTIGLVLSGADNKTIPYRPMLLTTIRLKSFKLKFKSKF